MLLIYILTLLYFPFDPMFYSIHYIYPLINQTLYRHCIYRGGGHKKTFAVKKNVFPKSRKKNHECRVKGGTA